MEIADIDDAMVAYLSFVSLTPSATTSLLEAPLDRTAAGRNPCVLPNSGTIMYKHSYVYAIMALFSAVATSTAAFSQEEIVHKSVTYIEPSNSIPVSSLRSPSGAQTEAIQPQASAPPLSNIFVANVCNASGCENTQGETSTTTTFTGTNVTAYVWEVGYGTGETATQGGNQLPSSANTSMTPFCQTGNQYTIPCTNGQTVVGYRYGWQIGPYLNMNYGTRFYAQDTSINSPRNTVSTSLIVNYSH